MNRPIDRWLIASIAALATTIAINGALALRNIHELHADAGRLVHSHEVIDALDEFLSTMKDAETGQRGYLITGVATYLRPYQDALSGLDRRVAALRSHFGADAESQKRLAEIEQLERAKLDELAKTIQLRDDAGFDAAQKEVMRHSGKSLMDELRTAVSEARDVEDGILRARQEENHRTWRHALFTSTIAGVTGLLAVVCFLFLLRRHLRAREAAAALIHEQREWFRTTLGSIGDAVIATDARGQITFANPIAESLTGWKQAEALGRSLPQVFRIVNEQSRATVENPATRALRDGTIVGLANHTVLLSRDGGEVPIDDSAAPIRDEAGAVVGVVLVFRDVTERRRAERALLEADRRKDEFLAILSHELRNPLAPISMAVALMRNVRSAPPEMEELRVVIERQTHQLTRLLDDLLDVSRIASGKIVLRMEPVSLGLAVASAVESVRPLIDAQGHELRQTLPATPIYVTGDLARLAQVIANLLNNAAKYTDPHGHLSIAVERDGPDAVVRVIDDGIGIPSAELVRIFGMFVQVERSLERDRGGLGVGLSLVKRLVDMHGGRVEARSGGPGKGSEFIVRLPAIAAPVGRSGAAAAPPRATKPHGLRVLVAEDNADSADLLSALLVANGYDVRTARDGTAALALAEEFRPDVALLDLGMPKVDGYEVARRIRAMLAERVLLIAISGWGQEEDKKRAKAAGFDHHLTKPVEFSALEQLLTAPRARRASA
jgi:PAS domain S-box-containing protein